MDGRSKYPGPGRRRLAITAKDQGRVVFHLAGPANIVAGKYKKWLQTHPFPERAETKTSRENTYKETLS